MLFKISVGDIICQQVTGKDVFTVNVNDCHIVVGIIGGIAVRYHIVGGIGVNAAADAFTIGSGFDMVGMVIRF